MKRIQKVLALLLIVCVSFIMLEVPGFAAEKEEYTYTVTISAGAQGTFNENSLAAIQIAGQDVSGVTKEVNETQTLITITGLHYGDVIDCDMVDRVEDNPITLLESRYYNKGIRPSGRDNGEAGRIILTVEGDASFVVAYGIVGNMTEYRIIYVNAATGEALAEPRLYYGVVGDKPVVPYLYMEGYIPQAYHLTKTLSDNIEENLFEFDYTPAPEPVINTVTNTVYVEGTTTETDEGVTTTPTPQPTEITEESTPTGGEPDVPVEQEEEPNTPQDIIDLDEEQVPLGSGENASEEENQENGNSMSRVVLYVGISAGVVLILVILFLMIGKKKKEKQ